MVKAVLIYFLDLLELVMATDKPIWRNYQNFGTCDVIFSEIMGMLGDLQVPYAVEHNWKLTHCSRNL